MAFTTENNNMKITAADICKGIVLLLLIAGNLPFLPASLKIITDSVCIPLLVFAEGCSYEYQGLRAELRESFRRLLKPYIIISIIASALWVLFYTGDINSAGYIFLTSLDNYVVGMSNTSGLLTKFSPVGIIWLLPFLYAVRVFYTAVCALCKRFPEAVKAAAVIAVAIAGFAVSRFIGFLPWSVDAALTSIVFMGAGDFLKKLPASRKAVAVITASSLIVWGALIYKYIQIDIIWRRYPYGPLCFICSAAGCLFIFAVSKLLLKVPYLPSLISVAGRKWTVVLGVYCTVQKVMKPMGWICELLLVTAVTIILCILQGEGNKLGAKLKAREEKKAVSGRLDWPDIAKGICMISIILGHLLIDWINQIVFLYDLPVFFLIAGYFLKKKDDRTFIKTKALRLLVPYYATCAVIITGSVIRAGIDGTSVKEAFTTKLLAALYASGDNWQEPYVIYGIGAIWFFWALFIALVTVNHFIKIDFYMILIPVIAFIGWASFNRTGIWLPLSIQSGMLASLYLLIGYEARRRGFDPVKINGFAAFILMLITAFGMQHFKGFWLVHNYFGNGWLDFLISIAASLFVICLSVRLSCGVTLIRSFFLFFGKNSLIILCFHMIEMAVLPIGEWNARLSSLLSLNALWSVILLIVLKILFCTLAVLIWNAVRKSVFSKASVSSPYSFRGK